MSSMIAMILCAAAAWGAGQDPYIGYAYPAGGQQGTVFGVTVAGQRLRNVGEVYMSGQGVRATVIGYEGAGGPLNKLQEEELRRQLLELRTQRMGGKFAGKRAQKNQKAPAPDGTSPASAAPAIPVTLPDLPELRNLGQQTNKQLQRLADKFLNQSKRPKPPIAEQVTLEVTIDAGAAPGDREIRLRTASGLSNRLVFQVGQIPETRGGGKDEDLGEIAAVQTPVVINGQIMPGEVDRWPLQLRGGQKLIIAVQARKLIPYLADAVPGWFQAAVAVCDANGKELAYDDDCGFVPDPVLVFQVPRDGQYTLEIRDALYRGREDFIYRVDIGEEPVIGPLFPLGSRGGVPIGAAHADWKLCAKLAEEHFGLAENPTPVSGFPLHSNPETQGWQSDEKEPNDTGQTSMPITLPRITSGCIATPGDKDVFRIEGHAGDTILAEVFARRMGSPLDSLLRLIDISGRVVALNDDHDDPEAGLFTHHADSYLSAKLPAAGRYFVQLSDAQGHGGADYRYYLRVGPPQPNFALRVTPSNLNVPAGRAVCATVCAMRKDGFDEDIEVALKNAPPGFTLSGAVIPKGRDQVRMTLTAPRTQIGQPIPLQFEGRAQIDGKTVTRAAVPADNMMQAFAYHHLVPAEQLLVTVSRGGANSISLDMAKGGRLSIPTGGSAQVSFTVRPAVLGGQAKLELVDPPAGVTLQDVKAAGNSYTLVLKADDKHAGYTDNLIVEAFAEANAAGKTGPMAQKQRVSLGVLPAIPFEIVKR